MGKFGRHEPKPACSGQFLMPYQPIGCVVVASYSGIRADCAVFLPLVPMKRQPSWPHRYQGNGETSWRFLGTNGFRTGSGPAAVQGGFWGLPSDYRQGADTSFSHGGCFRDWRAPINGGKGNIIAHFYVLLMGLISMY